MGICHLFQVRYTSINVLQISFMEANDWLFILQHSVVE